MRPSRTAAIRIPAIISVRRAGKAWISALIESRRSENRAYLPGSRYPGRNLNGVTILRRLSRPSEASRKLWRHGTRLSQSNATGTFLSQRDGNISTNARLLDYENRYVREKAVLVEAHRHP